MNEWNLIGHDWAVRRLSQQLRGGQLAQSHLFVGPPSVGKAALAAALASAVLSLGAQDPMRTHRLVDSRKHPDLTWVGADDGSIKVEPIREMLHTLTLSPVEGRQRVAVLDDAHLATESSKNAILKTLEEPNPSAVIILIAPSTDGVLPTITSRCQVLNLRAAPVQVLHAALVQRGVDDVQAELLARISRGRVGWALRALEDPDLLTERTQRLDELQTLLSANRSKRFEFAERLTKAGDEAIQSMLEEWLLYWCDVVRASSTAQEGQALSAHLHNIDYRDAIIRLGQQLPVAAAARMVRAITQTLKAIQHNASVRLALDVLLLDMPAVP